MMSLKKLLLVAFALCLLGVALFPAKSYSDESADDDTEIELENEPVVDNDITANSGTDAEVVEKEERAIKLDGMSVAETKMLQEQAESHEFQAEVNRMMKLIINSLYKNKDIFLRELISNASDALDKIRFLSLTDQSALGDTPDLHIKIHVDKENNVLHITDTGIGMTHADLVNNLGTIAKSGTSEFLESLSQGGSDAGTLIGQFGVGFYSAFLVADTVIVTTKHNDDDNQYIWTSDASSFTIVKDPREDEQLGRGTRISLYLKEEAKEFLDETKVRELVHKYSEFINFDIYLYTSKEVEIAEDEEDDEDEDEIDGDIDEDAYADDEDDEDDEDEEDSVDEEDDEDAELGPRTETVWDWEVINANKPIWTRSSQDVEEEEYKNFYKAFSKKEEEPLGYVHFTAEGEVTFRSILFIPQEAPAGFYSDYGNHQQLLKMYVRRVFITDEFEDLMPSYLGFITGVVDSDDLPLNVSRETLQQHKLLKVIKKKLVRKSLEMIKKLDEDDYKKFWDKFGTSIKLGLIDDYQNRTRLAKLLRFYSSNSDTELTSLADYVERMKKNQSNIFFMAGSSLEEVTTSPFVERLLKRGYEVLYLTEPIDEYTLQNLPEFDDKKFQNVAKEGLKLDDSEAAQKHKEELEEEFEPLTKWLSENLKDDIEKAVVSDRLSDSPCALVANQYGWSGNMERIMKAQAYSRSDDASTSFYAKQKKILEINPYHPLVKNLLDRARDVEAQAEDAEDEGIDAGEEGDEETSTSSTAVTDETLLDTAYVLLDTARLRSGFALKDSVQFAARIERMLRVSAGVDLNAEVEEEPEFAVDEDDEDDEDADYDEDDEDDYDEVDADEEEADDEDDSDAGDDNNNSNDDDEDDNEDNTVNHEEL